MKKYLLYISLIILFITSCENTYIAYHEAKDENTIEAYEKFIKENPHSKFVDSANAEIIFLNTGEYPIVFVDVEEGTVTEDVATSVTEEEYGIWAVITEQDDQESYEEYLTLYPDGYYADSATIMLYFMNKTLELKFDQDVDGNAQSQILSLVFGEDDQITGTVEGSIEGDYEATWSGELNGIREGMYLNMMYKRTMFNGEEKDDGAFYEKTYHLSDGGIYFGEDFYEVTSEDFVPLEDAVE
jgi:hypothetical protein